MEALTPIERALMTYRTDWEKHELDTEGCASVNPETLDDNTNPDYAFRYIDISSVEQGSIDWKAVPALRFGDSPSRARRVVRPGDLLIGTVRPLLGSHAFAGWTSTEPTICSTGFAVVRPTGRLLPEFLQHLAFAEQMTRQMVALQCGTNYPAITERDVRRLMIPVPEEKDQAAIVNLLGMIDKATNSALSAYHLAIQFKSTIINHFVFHGIRGESRRRTGAGLIANSWSCKPLGNYIIDGPANGIYRPESDYGAHGTPIVRIDSFDDGHIHGISNLRRVIVEDFISQRYGLLQSDVLINRVNSLSHIGKSAIVPPLAEPTLFESNMMRLRCGDGLRPEFLVLVLCSDVARRHWLSRAKPAVNQASINQRDVRELPIPMPSDAEEQEEIISLVAQAQMHIDGLRSVLEAQELLRKSLMHDLLTGKVRLKAELFKEEALV